ncbi:hypothetical protein [Saccharopolyspora spinosa]|uniref:hypothetical protein n=1 Tax=Saccharopolyspora spinosa TaxID=60894 RepID=UPI00023789B5|nr:hypothetical protein [Saccharopolyspora spinosa]
MLGKPRYQRFTAALQRPGVGATEPAQPLRLPAFTVTKEAAQRIRPGKPPGSQSPEPPQLRYDVLSRMNRRCLGTGSSED